MARWLITGCSTGLGREIARAALEAGHQVVATARRADAVADFEADFGDSARAVALDVTDRAQIAAAVAAAEEAFGGIDVLVNNAGYGEPSLLADCSIEAWNRTLAVTLTSVFLGLKYSLPLMRRLGRGVVVNTASISGTAGDYGMSAYNAAKAGVINLTRSAALECARDGIRVNCVCPGGIDTRVTQVLAGERAGEVRRAMAAVHPLGRMGEADEIANAILFLASDEASFITGAALVADGGLTAQTGLPPFVAR